MVACVVSAPDSPVKGRTHGSGIRLLSPGWEGVGARTSDRIRPRQVFKFGRDPVQPVLAAEPGIRPSGTADGPDPLGTAKSGSATSNGAGCAAARPNPGALRPGAAPDFQATLRAVIRTPPRRPHEGPQHERKIARWRGLRHAQKGRIGRKVGRPHTPRRKPGGQRRRR